MKLAELLVSLIIIIIIVLIIIITKIHGKFILERMNAMFFLIKINPIQFISIHFNFQFDS